MPIRASIRRHCHTTEIARADGTPCVILFGSGQLAGANLPQPHSASAVPSDFTSAQVEDGALAATAQRKPTL